MDENRCKRNYLIGILILTILLIILIVNKYYFDCINMVVFLINNNNIEQLKSKNKSIIEKDPSARETLILVPNRYRTFQEQSDYWLSRMENSEFSVDDLPENKE